MSKILRKLRAIAIKGPATARNIAFSQFDYWPVRRLRNEAVRNLPIYCVNLRSATRRRQIIERQAAQMGLTGLTLVDAIVVSDADRPTLIEKGLYDDGEANRAHCRSLFNSEIAASLSHGLTYDMIAARGHEVAMVIEDDCLFMPAHLDRISLEALPDGWDIAFLNSFMEYGRPRRQISGNLYHGDAWTGSAAAYLVSRNGARRLAKGYKPVFNAPDGYTGRSDLARYMYYPDCALNGSVCYYYSTTLKYVRVADEPKALKHVGG